MQALLQTIAANIASTAATSWFQGLGGRVYVNEAPADVALPLCVYAVIGSDISQTFGTDRESHLVEFTQYHPHASGVNVALESAEKLHTLLDNLAMTATGYDRVIIRAESRGVPAMQDDAIETSSRFRLTAVKGT
jgi:hypothetical protein